MVVAATRRGRYEAATIRGYIRVNSHEYKPVRGIESAPPESEVQQGFKATPNRSARCGVFGYFYAPLPVPSVTSNSPLTDGGVNNR